MDKKEIKHLLSEALADPDEPPPEKKMAPSPRSNSKPIIIAIIIATVIIVGVQCASILFSSTQMETVTGPYGKIHSPTPGTITGKEVRVTAETRNLEPGQYVWLAVDKPDVGLCWPKGPRLEPNASFTTTIYEGGPKEEYYLSLYIVSKTINDQWQAWFEKNMFGGLPILPDKRRLDSVRLILQ